VFDGNQNKHLGSTADHRGRIHDLIYSWESKRVYQTCLVETSVVDAHLKLPANLGNNNKVGQPPWTVDLPDKVGVKQPFDFFTDEVLPLNRLFLGLLLDHSSIGIDL
jgi:hypothetical protein